MSDSYQVGMNRFHSGNNGFRGIGKIDRRNMDYLRDYQLKRNKEPSLSEFGNWLLGTELGYGMFALLLTEDVVDEMRRS